MKTSALILALTILAGCATDPQKTAASTPAVTTNPALMAEAQPGVTIAPVAIVDPVSEQPRTALQAVLPSQNPATAAKPESGWDELSRMVANWSGTVHKAMSSNCPQETTAKP